MCGTVVGLEPAEHLHRTAESSIRLSNVRFVHGGVDDLHDIEAFDLIVLDNVYEHLPDQALALSRICRALRRGGSSTW